ncbi:hypothetical protein [Escherichia coli]|uniref:hypothetical protein n=1 Tax=Escherichia coli TaxID=562 RepID=UPI0038900A55
MYVWSAKANGFFPISEKEKFEASGLWPDDGVIVSEEEHKKLFMDIPLVRENRCAGYRLTEWKTSTDRYSSADQKGINSYC